MNSRYNYSTTGEIPFKLFLNDRIHKYKRTKKISPIHAIILITNACNLNCSFCNNKDIDRTLSLQMHDIEAILKILKKLQVDTITISGGGEPTCHENFEDIICLIKSMGFNIGLVTNGNNLNFPKALWNNITWCRISLDVLDSKRTSSVFNTLSHIDSSCEFTFSCVVSPKHEIETLKKLIDEFLNYGNGFLKFIDDLYINTPNLELKELLDLSTTQTIHYNSPTFTNNNQSCSLYQLKPIFAADGYVYPCCDIQYQDIGYRGYHPSKRICHYTEYETFIENQHSIKVQCPMCAHDLYNQFINCIMNPPKHENWI